MIVNFLKVDFNYHFECILFLLLKNFFSLKKRLLLVLVKKKRFFLKKNFFFSKDLFRRVYIELLLNETNQKARKNKIK